MMVCVYDQWSAPNGARIHAGTITPTTQAGATNGQLRQQTMPKIMATQSKINHTNNKQLNNRLEMRRYNDLSLIIQFSHVLFLAGGGGGGLPAQ